MSKPEHHPKHSKIVKSADGKITFVDEHAAALLAGFEEQLSNPQPEQWEFVKENASRTVYKGRVNDATIYLKHFHPSWTHRLRRMLGISDAMREMKFSRYLRQHHVRTAPALAVRCDHKKEWLATLAVEPAEPVDKWHESQLRQGRAGQLKIQECIAAMGKLIGKMHRAGVAHWDLHCGNILLRTDTKKPTLVLMDLHRMGKRRRLSRRAMAANLAQLFYDRMHCTTRTERLRFLKHYLSECGRGGTLRGWMFMIDGFAHRHIKKQHNQRDRRIVGKNRYFTPISLSNGWHGHVVLASKRKLGGSKVAEIVFSKKDWKTALADPEALFAEDAKDREVFKDTRSSIVVRRKMQIGPHEVDVFIKKPRRKKIWKILPDLFRPSRPIRAFKLGHELLTRRIATALPLAAIERRTGPFLRESILITESVDSAHLYDFMQTWLSIPPRGDTPLSEPQQRQLAQEVLWQLGRMLQQLHDNNFSHRDLKATNIRIRWMHKARPEVVLVDLDGLSRVKFIVELDHAKALQRPDEAERFAAAMPPG